MNIGHELLNAPFPAMVQSLGIGIAEAQLALDRVSLQIAQRMAGYSPNASGAMVKDNSNLVTLQEGGEAYSLLALGFTPTFYQFVETVIELKMSISTSRSTEFGLTVGVSAGVNVFFVTASASVSASFSQKYQYSAEGSSLMRTKLVTVPPPVILEERLREIIRADQEA